MDKFNSKMELITYLNNIQNDLLIWFSDNGRLRIPWKLKEDGSRPDIGEILSPMGFGLLK